MNIFCNNRHIYLNGKYLCRVIDSTTALLHLLQHLRSHATVRDRAKEGLHAVMCLIPPDNINRAQRTFLSATQCFSSVLTKASP